MYRLTTAPGFIQSEVDKSFFPIEGEGQCSRDYRAWVDAGNEPMPVAPPPVARVVTMRQARLALLGAGKLAAVNAAIADLPGVQGDAARIEWEYSQEVQRDKALVGALAPVLGFDDAQLDALFVAAAAL